MGTPPPGPGDCPYDSSIMSLSPDVDAPEELPPILARRFEVVARRRAGWLCNSFIVRDSTGGEHLLRILKPEVCSLSARRGRTGAVLQAWRAALALRHPGVATVRDVGAVAHEDVIGAWQLVELIQAPSLRSVIEESVMTTASAADLLVQVVDILDQCSPHGSHLGLSPCNVFIETQPSVRVRLSDYGTLGPLRRDVTTLALSDPERSAWLAPEQLSGRHSGAQTDMWQIGALFRYALTGASPSRAANHERLDKGARTLIRWLMHPDPLSRPDDFQSVRAQLEAVAAGSERDATPQAPTLNLRRPRVVKPEPLPVWLEYAAPMVAAAFVAVAGYFLLTQ